MTNGEPANIEISSGPYGLNKLTVNNQDWTTNVNALRIELNPQSVPVISVSVNPGPIEMNGPGIIKVSVPQEAVKERLMDFLSALDPNSVEHLALDDLGYGGNTTEAIINVIKVLAEKSL